MTDKLDKPLNNPGGEAQEKLKAETKAKTYSRKLTKVKELDDEEARVYSVDDKVTIKVKYPKNWEGNKHLVDGSEHVVSLVHADSLVNKGIATIISKVPEKPVGIEKEKK